METNLKGVNTNISYFTMRKIIGWSGLLLPWAVWLIAWSYQPSISDYYYTRSGVLFTSVLTLVGVFLISYRGFEITDEKISDNVITWIGGILIIIVAAIPTKYEITDVGCPTPICNHSELLSFIHLSSASAFFVAMGYLSLFHFTRGPKTISDGKQIRNIIYRSCGIGMWTVIGLAGVMIFILRLNDTYTHLVFWIEVILLNLFGISWLVKGKALVDLGIQKEN